MANITVAILGSTGYARGIGKAGTTSDITFYNIKRGEDAVTMIEPARYPERVQSLFFSVSMADEAILVVDEIDTAFGETVVMLHAVGVRKGYLILRNYLDPSRIAPLIRGTVVEGYRLVEDDPVALREYLLQDVAAVTRDSKPETGGIVPIDHHFNVKGIGIVILGSVRSGIIHKHDIVAVLPGKKTAQIRSIQKHDDDWSTASAGDRVGLALKNIGAEDLDRGFVLSTDGSVATTRTIHGRAELGSFWQHPLREGMVLHIGHWMQFVSGRVVTVDAGDDWKHPAVTIALDRDLVYLPGDSAVIHHLDAGRLRVAGSVLLHQP
ncbi:MAG: elongation factor Tu [Methanoculleus sp. SDB]|nr:MAG: elongation factor Tu [Methanoculleus sp. SDB]